MEHCQWKGIFFPVVMTSEYLWYTFVLEILINYNPYNLFFLNDQSNYFNDLKCVFYIKGKREIKVFGKDLHFVQTK